MSFYFIGTIWFSNDRWPLNNNPHCPAGGGCRIHRHASLQRNKTCNEFSDYYTKKSDGEVPVMLEHWGMRRIPLLALLSGPIWLRVVAPDRVLSMSQIELSCVFMLNWITWNGTLLTYKLRNYAKLDSLR